jgi:hypothetical protein
MVVRKRSQVPGLRKKLGDEKAAGVFGLRPDTYDLTPEFFNAAISCFSRE